ncbi:ferredoxin, partial [Striga asiatica]
FIPIPNLSATQLSLFFFFTSNSSFQISRSHLASPHLAYLLRHNENDYITTPYSRTVQACSELAGQISQDGLAVHLSRARRDDARGRHQRGRHHQLHRVRQHPRF